MLAARVGAIIFFAALAGGCNEPTTSTGSADCAEFVHQIAGQPAASALAHAQDGDYRLLAILGITRFVPSGIRPEVIEKLGFRDIDGTSDYQTIGACEAFQEQATEFAAAYNQEIARLAKEAGKL